MNKTLLVPAVAALCIADGGWADRGVTDAARSMDQLPQSVVETLQRELGGRRALEIEEIRYEGVPILYEAEVERDGREHEITVRPNGALVQPRQQEPEDSDGEDNGEGDRDADREADRDGLQEREVGLHDLPKAVMDALRTALGDREVEEIEEIRYDDIVVLYEAEVEDDDGRRAIADEDDGVREVAHEFFIYPYGAIATQDGDLIEREVAAADLPKAVADTLDVLRGREQADEIEEIRFEGIPILYEAQFGPDGQERGIAVFPRGQLAAHQDGDVEPQDGLEERQVSLRDLPPAVAETIRQHAMGGAIEELEEIRYEGIVVLYEAEVVRNEDEEHELYMYPSGELAGGHRCDDGDGDGDDDDDDDDDDGDGDDGDGDGDDGDDGD